jgi:tripartite-type tricarboxylate transporter receptor subunit TctC
MLLGSAAAGAAAGTCPSPRAATATLGSALFAEQIGPRLGQPVVVENRSRATGAMETDAVIRSKPDGYSC